MTRAELTYGTPNTHPHTPNTPVHHPPLRRQHHAVQDRGQGPRPAHRALPVRFFRSQGRDDGVTTNRVWSLSKGLVTSAKGVSRGRRSSRHSQARSTHLSGWSGWTLGVEGGGLGVDRDGWLWPHRWPGARARPIRIEQEQFGGGRSIASQQNKANRTHHPTLFNLITHTVAQLQALHAHHGAPRLVSPNLHRLLHTSYNHSTRHTPKTDQSIDQNDSCTAPQPHSHHQARRRHLLRQGEHGRRQRLHPLRARDLPRCGICMRMLVDWCTHTPRRAGCFFFAC